MAARIRHIFTSPGHNFFGHHEQPPGENPTVEVKEVRCVANGGLEGDRFFKPDYKGQVTFFAYEDYLELCAKLEVYDKGPGVFRRNVIVEGLHLPSLIGVEFELQGIRFLGTQHCAPCHWMDKAFGPGTEKFLSKDRGGLRAKVLSDGVLKIGS